MFEYYWLNENGFDGYCLAISDEEAILRLLSVKILGNVNTIFRKIVGGFDTIWEK